VAVRTVLLGNCAAVHDGLMMFGQRSVMGRRAVARREMIWNMLQGADAVSLAVKRRANSQGTQRGGLGLEVGYGGRVLGVG
jgi:hypothetical protein